MSGPRTQLVRLVYGEQRERVRLYEGMRPEELASVVRAVFGVVLLGFEADHNFVVPPEVVCAFPHLYDKKEMRVLTSEFPKTDAKAGAQMGRGVDAAPATGLAVVGRTKPIYRVQASGRELSLTDDTTAALRTVYSHTRGIEQEALHLRVMRACKSGGLDRDAFARLMAELLPEDTEAALAAPYLVSLSSLFDIFDTNDDGVVGPRELLSGLTFLCSGSIEERLQVVFSLMDADNTGFLSPDNTWRFLKASLVVILGLSSEGKRRSRSELHALAGSLAKDAVSQIFNESDTSRDGRVSFQEFCAYCKVNREFASWINVYDRIAQGLAPSSGPVAMELVSDDVTSDEGERDAEEENKGGSAVETKSEKAFVLSARDGEAVSVRMDEVQSTRAALVDSRIQQISDELVSAFEAAAGSEGRLGRAEFRVLMRALLFPSDGSSRKNKGEIAYHLDKLFDMFDVEGTGMVTAGEFVTGMLILTQGNRAEKLRLAFGMFDTDKDGTISRDEMFTFIESFLRVAVHIGGGDSDRSPRGLTSLVNKIALEGVEEFFGLADTDQDGSVSWPEFLEFYEEYGTRVKWLSLINEMIGNSPTTPRPSAPPLDDDDDDDDDDESDYGADGPAGPSEDAAYADAKDTKGQDITISIPLPEGGRLVIRDNDVTKFRFLRTLFSKVTPELFSAVGRLRFLDEATFMKIMYSTLPISDLSESLRAIVKLSVRNLYTAFDYNSDGVVDADELMRGLAMLAKKSKKDSLELVFSMMDTDKNGKISMEEMCEFFASFLLVTCAISEDSLRLPPAYLKQLVFQAAHGVTERFFSVADRNRDGVVSWDEFKHMYEHNRHLVPWLQILDAADESEKNEQSRAFEAKTQDFPYTGEDEDEDEEWLPDDQDEDEDEKEDQEVDDQEQEEQGNDADSKFMAFPSDSAFPYTGDDEDEDEEWLPGQEESQADDDDDQVDDDEAQDDDGGVDVIEFPENEDTNITTRRAVRPAWDDKAPSAGKPDDNTAVFLLSTDIQRLSAVAPVFCGIRADEILDSFRDEQSDGMLDRNSYNSVIANLFFEKLSRDPGISGLFRRMFNLFDNGNARVDAKEFFTGLWIMGAPEVADKLKLVFMFTPDDQPESKLTRESVERFVVCLMRVAFGTRDLTLRECALLRKYIDNEACELTDALFDSLSVDDNGAATFVDFASSFVRHPFATVLRIFSQRQVDRSAGAADAQGEEGVDEEGADEEGFDGDATEDETADEIFHEADDDDDDGGDGADPVADDLKTVTVTISGDVSIDIKPEDVRALRFLVKSLGGLTFKQLLDTFVENADGGVLDQKGFNTSIDSITTMSDPQELWLLRFLLHRMFEVFDQNGDGVVDCFEFLSGITFLLSSSLEDKLTVCFMLVDENNDSTIDETELEGFFRSFFSLVVAVGAGVEEVDLKQTREKRDALAKHYANALFSRADSDKDGLITIDEFRDAYSAHPDLMPWVKLIAGITKPVDATQDSVTVDAVTVDAGEGNDAQDDDADDADAKLGPYSSLRYCPDPPEDPRTVFLSIPVSEDGKELYLTTDDADNISFVAEALRGVDMPTLLKNFSSYGNGGELDATAFARAMDALVPDERLGSDQDRTRLRDLFKGLFFIFDRDGNGTISAHEFLCGLYVFCDVPLAKKMAVLFALVDLDEDGQIDEDEMRLFYQSVTAALVGLSAIMKTVPPRHAAQLLWNAAALKTALLFECAGAQENQDGKRSVTFEDFCQVCTNYPGTAPFVTVPRAVGSGVSATSKTTDILSGEPQRRALVLSEKDCKAIQWFASNAQFKDLDLKMMLRAMAEAATPGDSAIDGDAKASGDAAATRTTVDIKGFERVVGELLPRVDNLGDPHRSWFVKMLFLVLDRDQNGRVDVAELTAGLAVFLKGTRAQKLQLAFDLCDSDSNGFISRDELNRVSMSALSVMLAASSEARSVPVEELHAVVARLARRSTEEIFRVADINYDEQISFEEFESLCESNASLMPWTAVFNLSDVKFIEEISEDNPPHEEKFPSSAIKRLQDASESIPTVVRMEDAKAGAGVAMESEEPSLDDDKDDDDDDDDDDAKAMAAVSAPITGPSLEQLQLMRQASGLAGTKPSDLYSALEAASEDGKTVSRVAYFEFLRDTAGLERMTRELRMHVVSFFGVLFDSIDYGTFGRVPIPELSFMLCGFCAGDATEKLAVAFRMFDEDNDGYISKIEMFHYMRTLVALVLTAQVRDAQDAAAVERACTEAGKRATASIFRFADSNRDGKLDFDEFERLCRERPDLCPWRRVFFVFDTLGTDAPAEDSDAKAGDAKQAQAQSHISPDNVENNIRRAQAVLAGVSPQDLYRACTASREAWDLGTFQETMFQLIARGENADAAPVTRTMQEALEAELQVLFNIFDVDQNGVVDVTELVSGVFLLTQGSARQKLDFAFRLHDGDEDGYLTEVECFSLLMSFLRILLLYSQRPEALRANVLKGVRSERLERAAYRQARAAAQALMGTASAGGKSGGLSNHDFVINAPEMVPWLGMLELFTQHSSEAV